MDKNQLLTEARLWAQTTATGSVDESQQTYSADYDKASTQRSQHSEVASSMISKLDMTPQQIHGSVRRPWGTRSAYSRSTLYFRYCPPRENFHTYARATPDEVWENDVVFKEPFFTQFVLLTSNRSSDEANDQENANPLGLGRAYSVVDDSVIGSKPLMHDTTPRTKYEGEFHYAADFSETLSPAIPNAQPVGIAEQRDDYEEYYNRGSPQPTEVSEKPQFDRNVRQSRSLHNRSYRTMFNQWPWLLVHPLVSHMRRLDALKPSTWFRSANCKESESAHWSLYAKVRLSVSPVIPVHTKTSTWSNIERSTKIWDDVYGRSVPWKFKYTERFTSLKIRKIHTHMKIS